MADFASIEAQLTALDAKVDALEDKIEASKEISRICPVCGGLGYVVETNNSPQDPNYVEAQVTCPRCGGNEKIDWAIQEAL